MDIIHDLLFLEKEFTDIQFFEGQKKDQGKMLIVCHCYRSADDIIRIISARKATKTEAQQYIENNEGW